MKKRIISIFIVAVMVILTSPVHGLVLPPPPKNFAGNIILPDNINNEQLYELIESGAIPQDVTYLFLEENPLDDISPLRELINLQILRLYFNQVTDLSPLSSLINLTELSIIVDESDVDFTFLSSLINLQKLNIIASQVNDISFLKSLTKLESLYLGNNQINDLEPLTKLTDLMYLNLKNNKINNLEPLKNLTNLYQLVLFDNQISDISPLNKLQKLTFLSIESNPNITLKKVEELSETLPNCRINSDYGVYPRIIYCEICGKEECFCCGKCTLCASSMPPRKGCIRGNDEPDIFDFIEILQYLVGMDNKIDKCGNALYAALLTEDSQATGEPTIFDAIEILTIIVGL